MNRRDIVSKYLRRRFSDHSDSKLYAFTMWLLDVSTQLNGLSRARKLLWRTIIPWNELIEPIFSDIHFVRWLMLGGELPVEEPPPSKALTDDFEEHEYLGKGAFGYVVSGTFGGKPVALKQFMEIDKATAPHRHDSWYAYAKECAILSMMNDKCSEITGKLYGSGWYINKWCMILEPHQLKSSEFHAHESCTADSTRDVVRQLFSAIDAIHTNMQYIHGDIKPDNVMIDFDDAKRPRVKIIDFGLARPVGVIDDGYQYIETIYWRAPELLAEDTCDLVMTDVWATAITAFDIMTGIYSIHALGAKNDSRPCELYSILAQYCLHDDASIPDQWMIHIHADLKEFAGDIFRRYLVFVEERAGLKDLCL
jgi:serine/threonine protein kinase